MERPSPKTRSRYRGGSTEGVLVMLAVMGALTTTTIVVAPRYLEATPTAPGDAPPATPRHRRELELVARLVAESVGVVAVHDRGRSPFVEVVLWLNDEINPGQLDDRELGLLSHSRIMRTVSLYRIPRDADGSIPMPGPAEVREPRFCDRWRADGLVRPLILVSGVSEMQVEPIANGTRLRLTLTWSEESTDGADKASAVIGAGRAPHLDYGGEG